MSDLQMLIQSKISPQGTVNDYCYSRNGQYLALCDSEGYVYVCKKKEDQIWAKKNQFKVEEGSILSISWADPQYGNIVGIGTFSNRVLIYQEQIQGWRQIAYHQLHQGSVNSVEWSSSGLRLYAGSTDGNVSIIQLKENKWKIGLFKTGQYPITSLTLQPLPLIQAINQRKNVWYPRVAVATKDMKIKVYGHLSDKTYMDHENSQNFSYQEQNKNSCGYYLIKEHTLNKNNTKNILWRPSWESLSDSLAKIDLVYGTQEGLINNVIIKGGQQETIKISSGELGISKISQSMTGNIICGCRFHKSEHKVQVFEEIKQNQWINIKKWTC